MDIWKLEHNLSYFMTSLSREFIVHFSIGEVGYVDVSHMEASLKFAFLSWSFGMMTCSPTQTKKSKFYFVVNGICIHPHKEEGLGYGLDCTDLQCQICTIDTSNLTPTPSH